MDSCHRSGPLYFASESQVHTVQGNHVISIFGDPEEPVLDPIPVLEIQHDENAELAGFQFEQVQVIELAEPVKKYLPLPDFSENVFVREMFRSMRHLHGSGLGRRHQEIVEPIRQLSHLFCWGVYTYGRRSPKIGRQEEEKEEEEDSKKAVKYLMKTLNGRFVKEG